MIFYQVTFLSKIYKNTLLKYEKNYCTYLRLFSSRHLSEITLAESINQTANGTKNVWHVMFDVICTAGIRHDCHDNAPVIWNPRFRHWGIPGANQGFSPRFQLDWVPQWNRPALLLCSCFSRYHSFALRSVYPVKTPLSCMMVMAAPQLSL